MSRILVTGAAGYIGSAFCKEGLERGFNIIGIDNFSNSSDQSINFLMENKQHNFTFSEVDLCKDLESLREIFANNDINYVVRSTRKFTPLWCFGRVLLILKRTSGYVQPLQNKV